MEYTIGRTLIPRFFRSYFEGGVVDLSIKLRNTREHAHHNLITLECDQTDITTKNIFKHPATHIPMNVVVHTEGRLSLEFVSNSFDALLIKSWRFYTTQCHEYIDRSMTSTGLPNAFLVEPVTRHGLTKSTISYLKMCMIMEPMQDLMLQHRQTKMDPRSCLKHLLYDKYKVKNVEDNRAQPNKRRKRKAPAANGATGGGRKSKANSANNNLNLMNNTNNNGNGTNNISFNNNSIHNSNSDSLMSPSTMGGGGGSGIGGGVPNISLASQDVMVVCEPSMLGADFGDENERRITRLENNQFDTSVNHSNSITNTNNNTSNHINNQSQNQICNNTNNQNPNQSNNINHLPQQNNHNTGGNNIQMMNHSNSNNSNGDPNNSNTNNNNNNNCLPNNNSNSHQMNLMSINGNIGHMNNHLGKSEMDLKQSAVPIPTSNDSEAR